MQIVMKLAGYTLGRSDLVRRAMSKKKADVMAKERQYFVYGNEELGVPGCIARGIPEATANTIPWWILQNMHLPTPMQQRTRLLPIRRHF